MSDDAEGLGGSISPQYVHGLADDGAPGEADGRVATPFPAVPGVVGAGGRGPAFWGPWPPCATFCEFWPETGAGRAGALAVGTATTSAACDADATTGGVTDGAIATSLREASDPAVDGTAVDVAGAATGSGPADAEAWRERIARTESTTTTTAMAVTKNDAGSTRPAIRRGRRSSGLSTRAFSLRTHPKGPDIGIEIAGSAMLE